MDLTGAHERSVQIVGNGYIETRQFWFSPRGEFVLALITVVLADGSSTNLVGTNDNGVITVDGRVHYPDDTFLVAGFSVDGRATISHARPHSRDSTHWHYLPDGSGEVSQTVRLVDRLVSTFWQVAPDGAPVGDVIEQALIFLADGLKEVYTLRQRDGTVTTHTRVVNAQGDVLSDETTVVHFNPNPEVPPADGKVPTRPSPGGGGGAGGLEPTTRTPDPKVSSGGGWVGGGGASVGHITDWWYRGVDGRTTYLGSTTDAKTKKE